MGNSMNYPKFQAFDQLGQPLANGKLYTYEAGTTTPKATYSDAALSSPNANPIVLNARGEAMIFGTGTYKFRLDDENDVTIWTEDDISAADEAQAVNDDSGSYQYVFTPGELTADRNVSYPVLTDDDTFVFEDHATTLYNKIMDASTCTWGGKTITLGGNFTLSGSAALTFTLSGTTTLTLPTTGTVLVQSAGDSVQVVNDQDGEMATGTTVMPLDDTIPQNTEGDEYMTLAITPTSATSKLKIEVVVHLAHSTTDAVMVAALFQDSTANALAAGWQTRVGVADEVCTIAFTHYMSAATTSETTFKVRAGCPTAGTTTFNGISGARQLGGVLASSITITEVRV